MIVTITPRKLSGTIAAIPSKSHVHRLLICAALGNRPATLPCRVVSQDIEASGRWEPGSPSAAASSPSRRWTGTRAARPNSIPARAAPRIVS